MTIITWLWKDTNYEPTFTAEHVNVLASMLKRNVTIPYRFLCITDSPEGIKAETYPLWDELRNVKTTGWSERKPQCYVRLKAFSEEMKPIAGQRFCSIDLDCVITGNIDHILTQKGDFIINKGLGKKNSYNGSLWIMDSGARNNVYESFTPERAELASKKYLGSDQAYIRWILGNGEKTISTEEGIYSFVKIKQKPIPENMKIVFFQGSKKPWHKECQQINWIKDNWK